MKSARLVLLSFVLGVFVTEPILSIANRPVLLWGIPGLYAYIFGVWAFMIAAIAYALRREPPHDESNADE